MEELKTEGKARSIGVSNFRVKDLKAVLEIAKVYYFIATRCLVDIQDPNL